jgi:hypothetical protein
MVQFFTFVQNFFEDKPAELRLECLTGAYTPSKVCLHPESTYMLSAHDNTLTGVTDNEQDGFQYSHSGELSGTENFNRRHYFIGEFTVTCEGVSYPQDYEREQDVSNLLDRLGHRSLDAVFLMIE